MSLDDRLRDGLARNSGTIDPAVERDLSTVLARGRRKARIRRSGYALAAVVVVVTIVLLAPKVDILSRRGLTPSTSGQTLQVPERLAGRYSVDVASSAPALHAGVAGRWEIVLRSDGVMGLNPPRGYPGIVSGVAYQLVGHLIRSNALIGSAGCQLKTEQSGEYRWYWSAGTLRFQLVRDDCPARRLLFGQAWVPFS